MPETGSGPGNSDIFATDTPSPAVTVAFQAATPCADAI